MKYKKGILIFFSLIVILVLAFLLGPKPDKPDYSKLSIPQYSNDLKSVEDSIRLSESTFQIKADNESRIVWFKPYEKTEYSIVYLHGNAASHEEGDPIHEALAHRYGCNLFLARLSDHGLLSEEPMLDINAQEWMQSTLDALMIGHKIGNKVIVVSTSTGSTLALYLSSRFPDLIDGHILLSPNIDLYDPRSSILSMPWGVHIARQITGSGYYGWKAPGAAQQYWYTNYRVEGLCALKTMINHTMNKSTFEYVTDPLIMLYYYRDEEHQDKIVSVSRMLEMYDQLGTDIDQKKQVQLHDANTHIIGSDIFNDNLAELWQPLTDFCEGVLKLNTVNDTDWKPFLDQR